jgi:hypothetical protein
VEHRSIKLLFKYNSGPLVLVDRIPDPVRLNRRLAEEETCRSMRGWDAKVQGGLHAKWATSKVGYKQSGLQAKWATHKVGYTGRRDRTTA